MSVPTNTFTTMEPGTVGDFPSVTFCPIPGLNYTSFQHYYHLRALDEIERDDGNGEFEAKLDYPITAFDFIATSNVTAKQFYLDVMAPLLPVEMSGSSCSVSFDGLGVGGPSCVPSAGKKIDVLILVLLKCRATVI
jgi:hypothetical protein